MTPKPLPDQLRDVLTAKGAKLTVDRSLIEQSAQALDAITAERNQAESQLKVATAALQEKQAEKARQAKQRKAKR